MAEELHVLFGGGQVGQPLARMLLERGKRVRIVKRSAGGLPEGVELVRGDATDLNCCVEASRGASTVYHCMNPPYYARVWAQLLPRYMENLIAGCRSQAAISDTSRSWVAMRLSRHWLRRTPISIST